MLAVELPWPPSVNTYWRSWRGRNRLSARARKFRNDCLEILDGVDILPDEPLVAWLVLHPPTRRSYDVDNYIKPVLDALVHAKVIVDDSLFVFVASQKGEIGGDCCQLFVDTEAKCRATTKSFSWETLLGTPNLNTLAQAAQ